MIKPIITKSIVYYYGVPFVDREVYIEEMELNTDGTIIEVIAKRNGVSLKN